MPACPHCSRANPGDALFCFHDGSPIREATQEEALRRRFAAPFIFPSGRGCWTFDELALACQNDWPAAVELLTCGAMAAFLGGLGRHDLAAAARDAARFPDPDRALDRFLVELPARSLQPAQLSVTPLEIDLGRLRVGQNLRRELHLTNEGMGLLHGTISSNVPWLVVGEGGGASSKLFSCLHELILPIQIRGRALRASLQRQIGRLVIASSGGRATIAVKAEVPPQTFAAGVLAGARTPRQLAEKARISPRESARLFETGAVARWYQDNGWTYPIDGAPATGLAAVQEFFDALGLAASPMLELSETAVTLNAEPGEPLLHTVRIGTSEKRPVYARASSDQPWLVVSGVDLQGSNAHIQLSIPAVPDRPGETLRATLAITGNGRQKFTVPVSLKVAPAREGAVVSLTPVHGAGESVEPSLEWLPLMPVPAVEVQEMPVSIATASAPEWLPSASHDATPPPRTVLHKGNILPPPVLTSVHPSPIAIPRVAWLLLAGMGALLLMGFAGVIFVSILSSPQGRQSRGDQMKGSPPALPGPVAKGSVGEKPSGEKPHETAKDRLEEAKKRPSPPIDSRPIVAPPIDDIRPRPRIGQFNGPPPLAVPEFISREVEVVFCIDTTGSMGGLLAGAKQKIWAICNQIASGKPVPQLRVGLVAYKDKGDIYITKVFDLTRDLDAMYAELNTLTAAGGGDTPESVNQALDNAVNRIKWSTDKKTLRMIFLVGDAPPHMDYTDDVKYSVTCKKAVAKGILINTVQCGRDSDCERYWKDIAAKAEGAYVRIPQGGGVVAVATRFDDALARAGADLLSTALIYGNEKQKRLGQRMLAAAGGLRGPTAADRAAFAAKSKRISPYDLLDAVRNKTVKLEDVKDADLPDRMKGLRTLAERQTFLDEVAARREKLQKEAVALERKRADALAEALKKRGGDTKSFDLQVLEVLRKQAKKFEIDY